MFKILDKVLTMMSHHKQALIFAVIAGFIFFAPYWLFILSQGHNYQDIPFMQIDDEDIYLARMQDIVDGHYWLGSPVFYDYKNEPPMVPPVGEYVYVLPALLFHIPLTFVLIVSKFVFPFILFLLIYVFIYQIVDFDVVNKKLTAVAGSLLVVLGYDLIDYHFLFNVLTGKLNSAGWLLWARPVNPILGAIFLFAFLLFLINALQKNTKRDIFGAGLCLSLMICSYFFSWGMAFSILFILGIIFLIKKEYQNIKKLFYIVISALIFSAPYWYMVFLATKSPWYKDAQKMSGLLHTHQIVINKVLLLSLILYSLFFLYQKYADKRFFNEQWFILCSAFLIGGLWAFNQQIFTGIAIWPFHFTQYSIPLALLSLLLLFYYIFRQHIFIWQDSLVLLIIVCIFYGIFAQSKVYINYYDKYSSYQSYSSMFNYLNNNTAKDSVILVKERGEDLTRLIPALTHNNVYVSSYRFTLIPEAKQRFRHNYMVLLRLKNIAPEVLADYLAQNREEALTYLSDNWYLMLHNDYFGKADESYFNQVLNSLNNDYKYFYNKDFKQELKKYRLDYILSDGELANDLVKELPGLQLKFYDNNFYLYELN